MATLTQRNGFGAERDGAAQAAARITPAGVVVVDDDPGRRARVESSLAARGYRVRSVADPAEALDCVRESPAAVVILGVDDGSSRLDLIRRLRGRFEAMPLCRPPRIVVAAADLDACTERFTRRLGADVVLRTPVTPADLIAAVRQLTP